MKSNFFKIVLPAFALMLAITASLAFTSNTSNEDIPIEIVLTASDMTQGFWDNNGVAAVISTGLRPIICDTNRQNVCTVNIPFRGPQPIYRYNINGIPTQLLYKPQS